jgi:signal transduction histidine kinase
MMTALVAAGAAALAVDADGTVTSATPEAERLLSTPIARLRGARFTDLLSFPDQAGPALAAARRFGFRQSVAAAVAGDGPVVALEWVPSTELEAGVMVLVADQPSTEEAERLRLQTRLVSFIAHDVRNSLAAVFCGLRTLSDQMDSAAPERVTLDKALADIRRASRIVDDVLTVSRPGRLNRVDMGLPTLLAECVNRFRLRAAAHGIQIVERYGAPARVLADQSQLERAFDNLIENALQAMPHGGSLTVSADFEERAGQGVLVAVTDTGLGIPADVQPNVFEPYATRKRDGNGLGLAITLRAVLDHEGQISFTTVEGRGTTFSVWLPCI